MDVPADRETPVRLSGTISWLLTQTASHASRLISDGFARAGARGYHYRVLATLDEFGAASQATLGRRSGIHVSDIVATVNELVAGGHVKRTPDLVDRRRNVVTITAEGRRRLRWLDERVREIQDELLAPLAPAERDELKRLLTRLLSHHQAGAQPGP